MVGVGFDFDSDADHDIELDADIDADVGVDLATPSHADHGVFDADFDHDHNIEPEFSLGRLLSPLGVGKVPLSIVWQTYFLAFGISGFISSFILSKFFELAFWYFIVTLPLALVAGWHLTKLVAKITIPLFKTSGIAESDRDIQGRIGFITSLSVDDNWGEARLNINGSTNHMAVVTDETDLKQGDQIVVVGYDEEKKRPIVNRLKA